MIYLLMVPAMAAAIWAWRLAEASNARLKADLSVEKMNSSTWAKSHGRVCNELAELSTVHQGLRVEHASVERDLQDCKENWVKAEKDRVAAWKKIEALENEIEGLNVDKLYLKERLRKFETDAEKRREQKRAGMRRFRAKKREAKG